MAAQTSYSINCPKGVAGGLYDLSAHEVSTRSAEGSVTFGMGVVAGTNKGIDVKYPVSDSTAADFEGVVVHNSVMAELDMKSKLMIEDKKTIGCLKQGKIWVKTGEKAVPAYKETLYLITDGEETGKFTTSADTSTKIAVNGYFLGVTDNGIANAEFFPAVIAGKTE